MRRQEKAKRCVSQAVRGRPVEPSGAFGRSRLWGAEDRAPSPDPGSRGSLRGEASSGPRPRGVPGGLSPTPWLGAPGAGRVVGPRRHVPGAAAESLAAGSPFGRCAQAGEGEAVRFTGGPGPARRAFGRKFGLRCRPTTFLIFDAGETELFFFRL